MDDDDDGFGDPSFDINVPLLSRDMSIIISDIDVEDIRTKERCRIQEGSSFIFFYDEGNPTRLLLTVDRIYPIPNDRIASNYPCLKEAESVEAMQETKRRRLSQVPLLTITMDEAFPNLRYRVFREHGVKVLLGRGCEEQYVSSKPPFCVIWGGGGPNAAYQRSVECYSPFADMDEFFLCCDEGIKKQVSPGYSCMMQRTKFHNTNTNEVFYKEDKIGGNKDPGLTVIASLYPTTIPSYGYHETMIKGFGMCPTRFEEERRTGIKEIESWSTWSFNFSLPKNWKTMPCYRDAMRFSFARQFPKCNKWLLNDSSIYYWMKIEHGILYAIKGRANRKKQDNVHYQTQRHNNLHDMFADMESQLVLPKGWR